LMRDNQGKLVSAPFADDVREAQEN
jgi:hypothetical protein